MLDVPIDFSLLRKVIIYFYSVWCGPCEAVSQKYLDLSKEYTDIFFYKINVEIYRHVADEYKVKSIPCFVTLMDGKEHSRLNDVNEKKLEELVRELREK